jgi:MFS family permease
MATSGVIQREPFSSLQRNTLILLFLSVVINYIDRGNLSVAAPKLSVELAIMPQQLGVLHSMFFLTYALFQIPCGWLVDRYNVNVVFAAGYALWSLATGVTGFASTFTALVVLRLLLGAGEAVAYPSYSKIIANTFAEHQRGLANALIDAGTKLGPTLGTLIGGLIVSHIGWRALFWIVGFLSLAWIAPWLRAAPPARGRASEQPPSPPIREIIGKRAAWGTFLGLFCINYAWYFLLTWMPYWLVKERGFTMDRMAVFGSIPYLAAALGSTFWGWLSDHLIRKGHAPSKVRKSFVVAGQLSALWLLAAVFVPSNTLMIVFLTVALMLMTLTSSHWAITQRLAGPVAAGKWTGIQNFFGNLSGVAAPAITGFIVQRTGQFYPAFILVVAVILLGACCYGLLIRRVDPIEWSTSR